jgi:glycosyltransferase involved in cell wall biosynthesis
MTEPLVSVVIPTYNHAHFLAQAIDSVLAQDYPHLEVVVVDDGSTDDTGEVLERYRGRVVCERQRNQGQSVALNRGWEVSRGAIVSYLNADDVLRPGAVRRAVEALAIAPEAAFVYGDFELIDASSQAYRTIRTVELDFADMVARFITVAGPGGFFRRSALNRAGGWDPRFRQNPDVDFLFRLGLTGTFVRVPAVMAAFRVHGGSQTHQVPSIERAEEPLVIADRFFARPDIPDEIRRRRSASLAAAHVLAARQHLRARRWRRFGTHAAAALRSKPGILLDVRTIRLWLGALRPSV